MLRTSTTLICTAGDPTSTPSGTNGCHQHKQVNLAPFSLLEALHLSQIQKGSSLSRNSSEASDEHMWEQVPDKEKHSLLSDYKN